MSKAIEIAGESRSFGKRIVFRRVLTGVDITIFGKRNAFLDYTHVGYQELKAAVASIPEDPYADVFSDSDKLDKEE